MEDQSQNNSIDSGNTELEACKKQAEEYLNNWKRERADFLNYKKDEAKRMEDFVKFANENLILELIETLDDLYLAAQQVKDVGLAQVMKKFEDFLSKCNVEKIQVGEKFDPILHEAVGGSDGDKIEEIRAGYMMHGRVIRPTRVKIIK